MVIAAIYRGCAIATRVSNGLREVWSLSRLRRLKKQRRGSGRVTPVSQGSAVYPEARRVFRQL